MTTISKKVNTPKFWRYTDLPDLLGILAGKRLTLRDTDRWDDSNDRYVIARYRRAKKLLKILALCFMEPDGETYHQWKVFAPGSSGVRIEFDRREFMICFKRCCSPRPEFRSEYVDYTSIVNLQKTIKTRSTTEWPFLKRLAFKHECEFRIIYESSTKISSPIEIPITLDSIRRITLSPWLHEALFDTVAKTIKNIKDCADLKISHSDLLKTEEWRECFRGPV
jgi:hypothetical protein